MNIAELIDRFVLLIDPAGKDFRRVEHAPWIDAVETKLPRRLPASFRSLVTRYVFPPFMVGGLDFFANRGAESHDEFSVAIFQDRLIADATLKSGYIQFARPEGGGYDPICFNSNHSTNNREFPIVQIDHEDILCRDRVREVATISKSFHWFVTDLLGRT